MDNNLHKRSQMNRHRWTCKSIFYRSTLEFVKHAVVPQPMNLICSSILEKTATCTSMREGQPQSCLSLMQSSQTKQNFAKRFWSWTRLFANKSICELRHYSIMLIMPLNSHIIQSEHRHFLFFTQSQRCEDFKWPAWQDRGRARPTLRGLTAGSDLRTSHSAYTLTSNTDEWLSPK